MVTGDVTVPPAARPASWPADTSVPLSDQPIGSVLARQAALTPDRPAVVEWLAGAGAEDGQLGTRTYRELLEGARCAARGLLADARPGDRVAVWAPNSIEWIVIEFAMALAGLELVPLNPALTEREAEDLLRRSRSVAVLAVPDFRARDLLGAAHALAERLPHLRRVLRLADALADLGTAATGPLEEVSADAPFLIQSTSGTTGAPKGAVLTQRNTFDVGALMVPPLDLGEAPVWVNPLPLHHVGASVCGVMPALAAGGTYVTVASFDPAALVSLLEGCGATFFGGVPTVLLAMMQLPDFSERDLTALRTVMIGGSTVAPELIPRTEQMFGARLVNAHGQSEAPSAAQTRLDDSDEVKAGTIGRPGLHREARIVRPGTDETADFGESGEVCLRSPLTMTEYFDDPQRTAETFDGDGCLHTGDLCSMDTTGNITIHGRLRDVVIRGGENVYPAEVEDVLLGHPAVADVAVVGAADERWGEQVAAFVRFRPGAAVDWVDLEAYARESLAGFKVPRIWRAVDEFPLTALGKVQKFRLREALS